MSRVIPLFPLPLVLFPRGIQALHIFEPRYRQLLADCLASDREFGLIYRPAGVRELDLQPGTVGCVAQVESHQVLADGRSNIMVLGRERFAFRGFADAGTPYHSARVDVVADVLGATTVLEPLARQVREVFRRAGAATREMHDDPAPLPDLTDDPADLPFAVAQFVDLALDDRQRLLASRSAEDRLRQLLEILSPLIPRLEQGAEVHQRARTNGHGPHGPHA